MAWVWLKLLKQLSSGSLRDYIHAVQALQRRAGTALNPVFAT